jgi:vancomycin permeability regulator SanA
MTREKRKLYLEKRKIHKQKKRAKKRLYAEKKRLHKKKPSLLKVIFACLSLLAAAALLAVGILNAVVIGTTAENIRAFSEEEGYGVAVVFGAKVHEGGALSAMLEDRMKEAVALYHAGKVQKILVSGDGRGEWSETKHMKAYAIANGVAEKDVIEDGEGYSTLETVTRAKELFGIEKCVLVTQKYHLYRAMYAAESMGMDVVGAASNPRPYYGQFYRDLREILARVKDFTLCIGN